MVFTSFEFLIFFPLVVGLYFALPVRTRWVQLLIARLLLLHGVATGLCAPVAGVDRLVLLRGAGRRSRREHREAEADLRQRHRRQSGDAVRVQVLQFLRGPVQHAGRVPGSRSAHSASGRAAAHGDLLLHVPGHQLPGGRVPARHAGRAAHRAADALQGVLPAAGGRADRARHALPFRSCGTTCSKARAAPPSASSTTGWCPGCDSCCSASSRRSSWRTISRLIVQPVYAAPDEFSGPSAIVATLAFSLQIFFDFSAYTDIARGISRVLGFELIENFKRPYLARNIADFWQRWHISLSSWFRDYLYIPLGGNRVARWRWFVNLWIVFLLCASVARRQLDVRDPGAPCTGSTTSCSTSSHPRRAGSRIVRGCHGCRDSAARSRSSSRSPSCVGPG